MSDTTKKAMTPAQAWFADNDEAVATLAYQKLSEELADKLTFERSPEMFPQATYSLCRHAVGQFIVSVLEKYDAHLAAQRDVLVDFESLGTAGPFKIVEGRITLPIVTIKDIAQMYDAAQREGEAVAWRIKNYNPMFNGGYAWSFTCDPKSVTTYHEPLYTAPPHPRVVMEAAMKLVGIVRAQCGGYQSGPGKEALDAAIALESALSEGIGMTDTTKKAMTLEPCPFCGSSAKLFDWEHDTHGTVYSVTCENEECPIAELYADRPTEAQAIAAWNTRHRTAPRAITLSEALNTLSDFVADGGTLHSDYAYELHAAVDKIAQREGEAAHCASVQRVIDAALALISDAEEFETTDGLVNAAQLHLWHALEDAIENVGPAEIINTHLSAQRDVLVDFESLGTAGPFKIVEGRITLPIVTIKDIVQMYDAAPREGEAVGEYLANVDEYGGIRWIGAKPPHGTKLYTAPPHSRVDVTDEMVDRAMTAYDEFLGMDDEADYEAMRSAIHAAINGNAFFDSNIEERMLEDAKNACPHCGGSGHKDDAKPQAEPYAYIYEYDTYAGVYREFSPLTWNGLKPVRAVPIYTAQPSPLVELTDEMVERACKYLIPSWDSYSEIDKAMHRESARNYLEAALSEKGHG